MSKPLASIRLPPTFVLGMKTLAGFVAHCPRASEQDAGAHFACVALNACQQDKWLRSERFGCAALQGHARCGRGGMLTKTANVQANDIYLVLIRR